MWCFKESEESSHRIWVLDFLPPLHGGGYWNWLWHLTNSNLDFLTKPLNLNWLWHLTNNNLNFLTKPHLPNQPTKPHCGKVASEIHLHNSPATGACDTLVPISNSKAKSEYFWIFGKMSVPISSLLWWRILKQAHKLGRCDCYLQNLKTFPTHWLTHRPG